MNLYMYIALALILWKFLIDMMNQQENNLKFHQFTDSVDWIIQRVVKKKNRLPSAANL